MADESKDQKDGSGGSGYDFPSPSPHGSSLALLYLG